MPTVTVYRGLDEPVYAQIGRRLRQFIASDVERMGERFAA